MFVREEDRTKNPFLAKIYALSDAVAGMEPVDAVVAFAIGIRKLLNETKEEFFRGEGGGDDENV